MQLKRLRAFFEGTTEVDITFSSVSTLRYVHVPSRVDPMRAVEQKKKHVAQLQLIHKRELGQLPALKKGSF